MHCFLRLKIKILWLFFKFSNLYKTLLHFSTVSKKQVRIEKFMSNLLLFFSVMYNSLLFRKQDVSQAKLAFY